MEPAPEPRVHRIVLALLTVVSLSCGTQPKESPEAAAGVAAAGGTSVEGGADGVPAVTNFGVPECDAYVAKYMACLDGKVSPEEREKVLATFEANRSKWRAMSTMKEAAGALGTLCRAASQKAKEELSVGYGCEF